MPWNWELPDWPQFYFNEQRLLEVEKQFLMGVGSAAAYLKALQKKE